MSKTTFKAHTDIALIKYWGKKDEKLRLPENGSVSMKLSELFTTTTVDFSFELTKDVASINGFSTEKELQRTSKHLDRIRAVAAKQNLPMAKAKAKVVSENNFPKSSGLSSSGSGFAALTLAASKAVGLDLSQKELSILARQGSGSACRAVCGGFVEWKDSDTSEGSFSETIFPATHFDIRDVVVVTDPGPKRTSSTQGHTTAQTSLLFQPRQNSLPQKIEAVKTALSKKEFQTLGSLIEQEALEFHSVLLTSDPSFIAIKPGTVQVMHAVLDLRDQGVPCYFTLNTGHNIHVLTLPEHEDQVSSVLSGLSLATNVIRSKVAADPEELSTHLF